MHGVFMLDAARAMSRPSPKTSARETAAGSAFESASARLRVLRVAPPRRLRVVESSLSVGNINDAPPSAGSGRTGTDGLLGLSVSPAAAESFDARPRRARGGTEGGASSFASFASPAPERFSFS